MLTGLDCYNGNDAEVIGKCRSGLIDYSQRFELLPKRAQEFVRHLLVADPTARPSAEEALRHPWLSGESGPELDEAPSAMQMEPLESGSSDLDKAPDLDEAPSARQ